jgi:glycerol-3-phosphate acyltransferase PlsY
MDDLILYLGAFLIGSIPFGFLLAMTFKKIDLRKKGTGDVGVTNAWKVAGTPLGLLTLVLDILKGGTAIFLAHGLSPKDQPDWVLAGFLALLADEFPVFFKFKGGRGIGTSIGVFASLLYWMLSK